MSDEHTDTADGDESVAPADESHAAADGLRPTRRRLLQGTAAATAAASLGGIAVGQDGGDTLDPAETIVLGGRVEGWQGRDPASIDGQVNPTLNLQVGETYDLTWINVDGLPHNFVITNPDGSVIRRTEIVNEQGAEQSISFKVTEDMATYLCEVHPTSMVGAIQTGDGEAAQQQAAIAEVPDGPEVGVQQIAGDPLTQPVGMETAMVEGTERQFVVDQTGEIYLVTQDGVREFLDITDRLAVRDEGFDERGLLGMAAHPDFASNRRFYVRYSGFPELGELPEDYDHMFVLAEFQANEAFTQADPTTERRLLEIPEPQFNHNAGDLDFGPDGYLYVSTGDGGGADDTGLGHVNDWYQENRGGNGQDVTENLLGSMLRIDVNDREGDLPYGIPSDNPLAGDTEGLSEQYAWGFRNPWRFSFNDGQLIVADVGQNLWEEIDVVEKGGNYGWNVREGSHCFSTEQPSNPEAITECPTNAPREPPYDGQPLVDPVLEYPHTVDNAIVGISVTGGYVYQGDALSELSGQYVFGDWSASFGQPRGRLWVADLPETTGGEAGDAGAANETAGNATGNASGNNSSLDFDLQGNETGNETDNGTADNATNVTAGNETANATAGNATDTGDGDAPVADVPMRELVVAGSDDGELHRTILAFGRDQAGELYVLTSTTTTIDGTGEVYKIVPPGEGDQITPPGDGGQQGG